MSRLRPNPTITEYADSNSTVTGQGMLEIARKLHEILSNRDNELGSNQFPFDNRRPTDLDTTPQPGGGALQDTTEEPNPLDPVIPSGYTSSFQGEANATLEEILNGSLEDWDATAAERAIFEQIQNATLAGGGINITVDGESGVVTGKINPAIPGLPVGAVEFVIVDENGNFVGDETLLEAAGDFVENVWETATSIPQKVVDGAKSIIEKLQEAGAQIGGVSSAGDIFDVAGNIIGSVLTGTQKDYLDGSWLDEGLLGLILTQVGEETTPSPAGPGAPTKEVMPGQPIPDETGGRKPVEETIPGQTVPDETGGRGPVKEIMPDAPIPDETGGRGPVKEIRPDAPIPDETGGRGLLTGGGQDSSGGGGDVGGSGGGSSDVGGGSSDVGSGGGPVGEDPVEDPAVGGSSDSIDPPSSGGGGGGGGGLMTGSSGYMGGLGYDLARPTSVLYDPVDPMVQLEGMISRSLFEGIV